MKNRWCVQHREGWCACEVNRKPAESNDHVPTVCGHVITLPFGFEKRQPTCKDCRKDLK